ncbi:helix-turn-helix transcriptional regulator [Deefgea salmonis]|uniref:AlpA family phage regulatory protein n=1 Tax=Deefgea salmonis TaxID=2875502 RepID=A0ABS8BIF9_9NEIS|nr:AlpA family phage regulatory protein [Deefgea salmonis]MCB5195512.1 AlpA family phage regulatory protein [Deefgea salmonis]
MPQRTTSQTVLKPDSRGKSIPISKVQAPMLTAYGALPATGFIRQRELLEIIPFSASTLWRRVRMATFPAPTKLSERVTAWQCEAVRQWLDEQGGAQ